MNKNKVFCILGKFASGKTTIANLLQDRYGLKRVVTCTTRKMREGERDGIDYYYYTDEVFEELAASNKLAAINRIPEISYKSKESFIKRILRLCMGPAPTKYSKKYGVPIEEIDLSKNSYVCVIEPSGYYDLLDKLGKENIKAIYLNLSDKERWLRALNREVNPDVDGIVMKHLEEHDLYDGLEDVCDKVINNAGTSDAAAIEIFQYITSIR